MAHLMILVAGPYRSGTGDDPAKLAANVTAMHEAALPLSVLAGSTKVGDAAFDALRRAAARALRRRSPHRRAVLPGRR